MNSFKLITISLFLKGDQTSYPDWNSKRTVLERHMDNLRFMVSFLENKTDCRRTLQLHHFGEHYSSEMCLKNRASACDNCESKVCSKQYLFNGNIFIVSCIEQSLTL